MGGKRRKAAETSPPTRIPRDGQRALLGAERRGRGHGGHRQESVDEREACLPALSLASGEQAALRSAGEKLNSADTRGHLD